MVQNLVLGASVDRLIFQAHQLIMQAVAVVENIT
jgi:hypothetical protein